MTISDPAISALLSARIAAGDFPSAVYLVAQKWEIKLAGVLGNAVVEPQSIPATLDTVYDLASLTKPLITGMLCARRVERGDLSLEKSVSDYLPEFDRPDKRSITVKSLLTHSSGLPAWRALYVITGGDRARTLQAIADVDLEYQPGTGVVYSDLGFIVLGLLLERITNKTLKELADQEIFQPLALKQTFFSPEQAMQTGIAACESGNMFERDMLRKTNNDDSAHWREELIWGSVHDGNAYFLGGVAGHAGLFSNANETLLVASQFLGLSTRLLSPATCELFSQNLTIGLDEARSFGWQLAETKDSAAGLDLPRNSFGHSGFTGTSCWIDPNDSRIYILLTNRTHARALPFANINPVRRQFHTLAQAALTS
ncbi:MAG TPA: serine hydrolase [Pyrinomonadaceae bacterium]|nr:serine hydrolase [Pyrinomonadaceae bacterium]